MTASPPTSQPPPVASPSSSPNPNPNPSGPPPPNAPSLGSTSKPTPPTAPLPPLTGFQSALEHTGIPRSVLTWKPRLPSRNWSIFLTISGTLLYLWYDDRKQCRLIREETLRKVEYLGKQPMTDGSLGEVRKVKVYGARWPEDGDDDRALRHFRKYMKPYLVAAAIDYEPLPPPLIHGSVTRHIHSSILSKRRQALGLEPTPMPQSLPDALDPASADQRELEGGTVLVGRLSLKEYLEGLRRGWTGGVDEWSLEGHVKRKVEGDGVFDAKAEDAFVADGETNPTTAPQDASVETNESTRSPTQGAQTPFKASGLSFLSRPTPPSMPTPANPSTSAPAPPPIPAHLHTPPATLPPQAPLLLLPFTNHLGVMQFPNMIYDFFTERFKVRDGADAALALIFGQTRPFRGPTTTSSPSSTATDPSNTQESSDGTEKQQLESDNTPKSVGGDLDFDLASESYIRKSYNRDFLNTLQTARRDYYAALAPRIESARAYEEGKRELTEAEQSGKTKVETIEELKEERIKKEMRWMGGEDGFEVVRKGSRVSWDPKWEGWLSVFVKPEEDGSKLGATEHASS